MPPHSKTFRASRVIRASLGGLALCALTAHSAFGQGGGGIAIAPSGNHKLVWEFALDAAQHNEGRPGVAPIASAGTGVGRVHYDTASRLLRYEFSWSGLEGEVTSIELRGPARAHQDTRRRLTEFPERASIPRQREGHFRGEHTLTLQQQAGFQDLVPTSVLVVLVSAGAHVSIQTTAHPEGEIRGNLGTPQNE